MTIRPLVSVIGLPGSGRGLVVKRLVEHFGFTQINFMDPVEAMIATGFELDPQIFKKFDRRIKSTIMGNKTPDELVRTLAQEWGRKTICSDLWVNLWQERIKATSGPIIVSDAAYPNEVSKIKSIGGQVWRIKRRGERIISVADKMKLELPCDIVIQNEGNSKDRLYQLVNLALLDLEQKIKAAG